jgi:hypothetical protein
MPLPGHGGVITRAAVGEINWTLPALDAAGGWPYFFAAQQPTTANIKDAE